VKKRQLHHCLPGHNKLSATKAFNVVHSFSEVCPWITHNILHQLKHLAFCYRIAMTFVLPIRQGWTVPFLRKRHKIVKIVLCVTPNNTAASWVHFLISKTSQMICNCQSLLQGAGTFLKETKTNSILFAKWNNEADKEKIIGVDLRFLTSRTMTGENCTWGHMQHNKSIYPSIYFSVWKRFWKWVYIYICTLSLARMRSSLVY